MGKLVILSYAFCLLPLDIRVVACVYLTPIVENVQFREFRTTHS